MALDQSIEGVIVFTNLQSSEREIGQTESIRYKPADTTDISNTPGDLRNLSLEEAYQEALESGQSIREAFSRP